MTSAISVVIPVYNRSGLIWETLRSLLSQTLPAMEIIVVDDGSADDSAEIASSFGPPVKVIRQSNAGPAAARNRGFHATVGDYVHFFDSDDLAAPNKHEVQVRALESTGADIAYGPWIKGRFERNRFLADNHVFQQRGLPAEVDLIKSLLTCWSIVPHAAVFRRTLIERTGGFPEDLHIAEDQHMFLTCLLAGAKVVHTPETIEFYRNATGDKLTESSSGHDRRVRDWARFLLKARIACHYRSIEPLNWFGYRRRLWEAHQDLRQANCTDCELMRELRALIGGYGASVAYRCARKLTRWRGGLQRRLTGGRADASFRIGPMTGQQRRLLQQLGYEAN